MAYQISVDASGTSAVGVLVNEEGRSVSARASVATLEPAAGTLKCVGRLAEAAGMTASDLLGRAGTVLVKTGLAKAVLDAGAGARVGIIATRGFRTRLVFQPVGSPEWDGHDAAPVPDGQLMTEVDERIDATGSVLLPLDEESVVEAVRHLRKAQVEAVAVLLLFSPLYPGHEQRVADIVAEELPGVHVALSATVMPVLGEFARWRRTLLSACVAPAVSRYVGGLSGLLRREGFAGELLFSGDSGERVPAEAVVENPSILLPSVGPAPAPLTATGLPRGFRDLLSVDPEHGGRFRLGFHPGSGARKGRDGRPGAGFAVVSDDSVWTDVEHCEARCPVVVDELKLLEDEEGAGEYRGAPGVGVEVTLRAGAEFTAAGGQGELLVLSGDGVARPLWPGAPRTLAAGDRCVARCPGSRGWGEPLERDAASVQQDVIQGYLSAQRAREVYGVVLNPATLELQCDATLKLRAERRARLQACAGTVPPDSTNPKARRASGRHTAGRGDR